MPSGVILLQRPYISFSSPLLLILRREIIGVGTGGAAGAYRPRQPKIASYAPGDNRCGSGLVISRWPAGQEIMYGIGP